MNMRVTVPFFRHSTTCTLHSVAIIEGHYQLGSRDAKGEVGQFKWPPICEQMPGDTVDERHIFVYQAVNQQSFFDCPLSFSLCLFLSRIKYRILGQYETYQ